MSQQIIHPEWRDYFTGTKYPFADTATLVNTTENPHFIPEDVFLDAAIYPVGGQARLYLTRVVVTAETAVIYIGDTVNKERVSGSINLLTPDTNVILTDSSGRPAGLLVSDSDRLLTFQGWDVGEHVFRVDQTEFAARVCFPTPEIGVRGFELPSGEIITGDVWFVGAEGVILRQGYSVEPDPDNPQETRAVVDVVFDVYGDPLFRRSLCGDSFIERTFLKTITARQDCREVVCRGDDNGNLIIAVASQDAPDTILRVRTTSEGLLFETVGEKL